MSGDTVLITGCSSGIGRALAIEFAIQGFNVIATARRTTSLQKLTDDHSNITALPLDVCDRDSIDRLVRKVISLTNGKLAYLVNNAGSHYAAPALELEADRVRALFETNVFGVMNMCSAFGHLLIAGKGTIVQIGSVTRAVPVVWQSAYNSSKAALSQYSQTLRLELDPFGVKVCEIVTGYVQSDILRDGLHSKPDSIYLPIKDHVAKMKTEGNRTGMHPGKYAQKIVQQVTRRQPPYETWEGSQSWLLGFIVTWLPNWLQHRIWYAAFRLALLRR